MHSPQTLALCKIESQNISFLVGCICSPVVSPLYRSFNHSIVRPLPRTSPQQLSSVPMLLPSHNEMNLYTVPVVIQNFNFRFICVFRQVPSKTDGTFSFVIALFIPPVYHDPHVPPSLCLCLTVPSCHWAHLLHPAVNYAGGLQTGMQLRVHLTHWPLAGNEFPQSLIKVTITLQPRVFPINLLFQLLPRPVSR